MFPKAEPPAAPPEDTGTGSYSTDLGSDTLPPLPEIKSRRRGPGRLPLPPPPIADLLGSPLTPKRVPDNTWAANSLLARLRPRNRGWG